jgi:ATP-dependent Clp protease ATP-binding subunit ClpA
MFDRIKALFVVSEKGEGTNNTEDEKSSEVVTSSDSPKSEMKFEPTPGSKPDEKFVDVLLKAIEMKNLEGFDYLEYKQSLQSLANMNMDEATRFKSAFAMAKTMGSTPEKLIKAAGYYVSVLEEENKKFTNAVHNQMETQVKGRENAVMELQNSIKLKDAKIAELQKEIAVSKGELEAIKSEISGAEEKVKGTEASFQYAYKSVLKQIVDDMEKMKTYLK